MLVRDPCSIRQGILFYHCDTWRWMGSKPRRVCVRFSLLLSASGGNTIGAQVGHSQLPQPTLPSPVAPILKQGLAFANVYVLCHVSCASWSWGSYVRCGPGRGLFARGDSWALQTTRPLTTDRANGGKARADSSGISARKKSRVRSADRQHRRLAEPRQGDKTCKTTRDRPVRLYIAEDLRLATTKTAPQPKEQSHRVTDTPCTVGASCFRSLHPPSPAVDRRVKTVDPLLERVTARPLLCRRRSQRALHPPPGGTMSSVARKASHADVTVTM